MDQAGVRTRYPDDLKRMQNEYTKEITMEILSQTKEVVQWAKKMS
jgi:HEPN domain-containing protein